MRERKKEYTEKTDRSARRRLIYGLLGICAAIALIGGVAARYRTSNQQRAEMLASEFHFSSDYLEETAPQAAFEVSDWTDAGIQIHLYNYEKENVAQISETEIQYEVTAPTGWAAAVTDEDGKEISPEDGIYTFPISDDCTSHTLLLTYAGSDEPGEVTVTVTSVVPYKKTLTASFNLSVSGTPTWTVQDMGDYDVVTIETNDYNGTLSVNWNGTTHSPDNTNTLMDGWTNSEGESSGSFEAGEFTTYSLIFFEDVSGDYNRSHITIGTGE